MLKLINGFHKTELCENFSWSSKMPDYMLIAME